MTSAPESCQRARILEQFTHQAAPLAASPRSLLEPSNQLLLSAAAITSNDTVLDVACGTGQLALAVAEAAKHVTGVDITPAMIERAQALQADTNLTNIRWVVGDAYRLPFANSSFDVVTCRYALHHMLDPAAAVEEMTRVCAPCGRLSLVDVLTTPEKAAAFDSWERLRDPSHVRALTLKEFVALVKTSRFGEPVCNYYSFDVELETLLRASFPAANDGERVREMIVQDLHRDELGVAVYRKGKKIIVSYPIAMVTAKRIKTKET